MASTFLPYFGEDVEDICGKEELVTFSDVSCLYPSTQPLTVKYHLGSRVQTSPFDWIGIFPDQWADVSQPIARISLPFSERSPSKARRKSVTFSATAIKTLESKENKHFQFVYVNANRHVLGVSVPFKVKDERNSTSCKTEKGEDTDQDSERSESPVLLSSASEDEEEWDMSRHSVTLRQAWPAGTEASSASDLSDIVVLSTSPSQEAARLCPGQDEHQADVTGNATLAQLLRTMWGRDASHAWPSVTDAAPGERADFQESTEENGPRGKNVKIVFSHSENKPSIHQASKTKGHVKKTCEIRDFDDVHKSKATPPTSNIFVANQWNGDSILNKLRIIEIDSASEEEDQGKDTSKDKGRNSSTAQKTDCTKLITEMPESLEAPSTAPKILPVTKHTATEETRNEHALKVDTTIAQTNKKSVKKLKKKRQITKPEKLKDQKEETEVKERKHNYTCADPPACKAEKANFCYEDEILSGWFVNGSDAASATNDSLGLDKALKLEIKTARRLERSKVKADKDPASRIHAIVADEGELYETSLPAAREAAVKTVCDDPMMKAAKAKRGKKGKQTKDRTVLEASNKPVDIAVNTARIEQQPAAAAPAVPSDDATSATVTGDSDLAEKEHESPTRKTRHEGKAKTAKKVRRGSSRKRASQLSCEFQYLFSVDVKRSGRGTDEMATELEHSENNESSCRSVDPTLLPILDTSDEGFPALPSQQDSKETNGSPASENKSTVEDEDLNDGDFLETDAANNLLLDNYTSASPVRLGKKGEVLPYVPPYVLDVMDALPPASVSPDGRSMLEWRRSLLPYLPKHALPVFHNKYKAKLGRKLDLRRSKVKRATLSRHSGIIDRIRHQLAVPGGLDHIVTEPSWFPKSVSGPSTTNQPRSEAATEDKQGNPLGRPSEPASYASIVKKAIEHKDEPVKESQTRDSEPSSADSQPDVPPVFGAQSPDHTTCQADATEDTTHKQPVERYEEKCICRMSQNFPKEFSNYNTDNQAQSTISCLQMQLVPVSNPTFSPRIRPVSDDAEVTLSWPTPKAFVPPLTAALVSSQAAFTHGAAAGSHGPRLETPSLHIRVSAKAHTKTQSGSPPRRAKAQLAPLEKEKSSASSDCQADTEREEQAALLNMALSSCLVDNAELRKTVVSLERQLHSLKTEHQRVVGQTQVQSPRVKSQLSPTRTKRAISPLSLEQRKVPVCKWAGKIARLVRSNVEIISLSAKVKDYELEIASLQNQLNSLKEALQVESKRSRRALTKWFKAKLKVKVLRSRLAEVKDEEVSSSGDGGDDLPRSAQPDKAAGATQTLISPQTGWDEAPDDWEPPCKRAKLDKDAADNATNTTKETYVVEVETKPAPLLQPAAGVPVRVSRPPPSFQPLASPATPAYALTHLSPFFNLFPGNCSETGNPYLERNLLQQQQPQPPFQQAVVAPLYHNGYGQDIQHQNYQLHPQQQLQFSNSVAKCASTLQRTHCPRPLQQPTPQPSNPQHTMFQGAAPIRNQPSQR
ncbi:hypothetical protein EGW08_010899, partial [Elysia chlorotica]